MYVSVDGDDIGKKLTNIIYSGSEDEITEFSDYVDNFFVEIKKKILEWGGKVIFCAGDSIAYLVDDPAVFKKSLMLMKSGRFNVSVGCGDTIQQAHWALNIAKSLGKNQVQYFDDIARMLSLTSKL